MVRTPGRIGVLLVVAGVLLMLVGCAHQPTPTAYDPPGFFSGVMHGFLVVFSLIGSIFMDIRIYAFPNSGLFYDLGYVLGLFIYLIFMAGAAS